MVKDVFAACGLLVSLFTVVNACGDHIKRHQPSASQPSGRPSRPLPWGDLNIIHTTDTHGWLLGHLHAQEPEPNASGDFGDFQSFVYRMKKQAKAKGVDLLVIDTGDLHNGNGLSDAEPRVHVGTPPGSTSNKFIARVPYDLLAIGNHELYDLQIAQDMHDNFAPIWKGSYLTSNVNITTSGKSVPIGSRFRKFKTAHGRKVTAFGILFHFTANAKGTVVQPPSELIKEAWFLEALRDRPDLFILTGHMGLTDSDWKLVFDVVRASHPKVPIVILGGHLHIRDCRQLDSHSMSLASGRYMETIGWMSLTGLGGTDGQVSFSRRYLDPNRVTYAFHAGADFDTKDGIDTTHGLSQAAKEFNITYRLGTAPQSYFINRVPYTANNSMSYLLSAPGGVLETTIRNPSRPHAPLVAVNTATIRFDIFQGNFTVNDELITMPFNNDFVYIPDVPRTAAAKFVAALNEGGTARTRHRRSLVDQTVLTKDEDYHQGLDVQEIYISSLRRQATLPPHLATHENNPRSTPVPESYGYVTHDSCPGVGDDTLHIALPVHDPPEYISTALPPDAPNVDVVFYKFISSFALSALNKVQSARTYTEADLLPYVDVLANQMFGRYAQQKWN
ncbi:hypothetical protein CROQUDRAFT_41109 [Cronartium quercuum f. sp. fusiforme G11]|uniref:Putative 5'-nucleotidase C-terminal domain-containing protein n=1 Tax=Cronartium quercuum f. sp. fusiforme G11 TaxID=708437 RepID=A0A9P6NM79_9BASI|nr:hypothetical protein CROQUDRAFT_41109 [Cronartium quercuum f. sp. fusiforme G11]